MSLFTKNLREQSGEMREAVKEMLNRINSSSSPLREQLLQLATSDNVSDETKTTLHQLAEQYGGNRKDIQIITAISGSVTANVFDLIADMCDYLAAKGSLKTSVDRLQKHRKFNEAIRLAGAKGDWSEFDALIDSEFQGQEKTRETETTSGKSDSVRASNGSSGGSSTEEVVVGSSNETDGD